jgi:hypothetical protein
MKYVDPTGRDAGDKTVYDLKEANELPASSSLVPTAGTASAGNTRGPLSQNNSALAGIANMVTTGCYFRSCQAVAETDTGQSLTVEQITAGVTALQASGAVGDDMTISDPDAVINDAFTRLGQSATTATVNWGGGGSAPDATVIVGTTPNNGTHYRYGDSGGNVAWDPYFPAIAGTTCDQVLLVYIHRRQ